MYRVVFCIWRCIMYRTSPSTTKTARSRESMLFFPKSSLTRTSLCAAGSPFPTRQQKGVATRHILPQQNSTELHPKAILRPPHHGARRHTTQSTCADPPTSPPTTRSASSSAASCPCPPRRRRRSCSCATRARAARRCRSRASACACTSGGRAWPSWRPS